MPRRAREKSSTGVYHIMVRGINRQDIFNDEEDKQKYVLTLIKYKEICGCEIYGYCLMSNHIHLILKEGKEPIAQVMKRIGASYVYWYNMKYERYGHLFQDRFKSEIIENDGYLMVALRYIHQNPLKAGMVEKVAAYAWSSYNEYMKQVGVVTDIGFILNLFGPDPKKAVLRFKEFMEQDNTVGCLDDEVRKIKLISDEDVKVLIKKMTGSANPQVLQTMNKKDRDDVIRELRGEQVSIRQLARITGLGRGSIEKA